MTQSPVAPLHAVRLIVGIKFLKLRNQILALLASHAKPKDDDTRRATARAKSGSPSRFGLILFLALFISFGMSFVSLRSFENTLKREAAATTRPVVDQPRNTVSPTDAPPVQTEAFLNVVALVTLILTVGNIVFTVGHQNRGIGQLDAEVEQLLALPVSVPTIYLAKAAESLVLNVGWLTLSPFYTSVLWTWGYRWSAVPIALVLTFAMNFLGAATHFSLEILLRRLFSALMLNTLQAAALLFSTTSIILAQAFTVFIEFYPLLFDLGQRLGRLARLSPTSLLLDFLQNGRSASPAILVVHLIEIGGLAAAAWGFVAWASRRGLEAVHTGKRRGTERRRPAFTPFPGVVGKDFLLFCRDKRLAAQFLAPLVGFLFPALIPGVFSSAVSDSVRWGAVSLGIGLFSLMSSATTVIVREGDALWMLYTAPRSVLSLVVEKTGLCVGFSWVLSLSVFFGGLAYRGGFRTADLFSLACVVLGIALYGVLCASLGILGADPLAAEKSRRLRADLVGLAFVFGGLLIGGMFLPGVWAKVVHLIVFLLLTFGWAEKARAHVDYLLDPTALPPPRLHLADGLTTVLTFLILQLFLVGGLSLWFSAFLGPNQAAALAFPLGYLIAAGLTATVILDYFRHERLTLRDMLVFWRSEVEEARTSVVVAMQAGSVALALAVGAWYFLSTRSGSPPPQTNASVGMTIIGILGVLIFALVRPAFEEILFRGIVFQSFRQSVGFVPSATAAAFISAAWLPKSVAVPTFLLGLTGAWAYEKSRALFAPIMAQILYCLVLAGLQLFAAFSAKPL